MASLTLSPEEITSHLLSILASAANTPYIGEPVSQLEHSLQCAHFARTSTPKSDDETIVAALLHDIGQFIPAEDLHLVLGKEEGEVTDMLVGRTVDPVTTSEPSTQTGHSVGRISHETLGAKYLSALGFSSKVARLVEAHVAAKRYLCAVEPAYHDKLSDASKESLKFQGGPMQGNEKDSFARSPWCDDMCRLRKWDDEAKHIGWDVPGLDTYHESMIRVLGTDCNF
ncbi:hypothetical protein BT63DRAFT_7223 [Microthyrium microscopicum]|uniref:HD/PDEase domain-containing protein n=1 Tax=Microthyrium microscopicum TaxID=703497 RepID=A0A6A6URC4_9PEZI|nr:hypothetical protein BT63DRAFT_7223 [Microthyrium microscopicum]